MLLWLGRTEIYAIICAPYTDDTYDFETNVVNHGISILSIFIFLLLFAILMTTGAGRYVPAFASNRPQDGRCQPRFAGIYPI